MLRYFYWAPHFVHSKGGAAKNEHPSTPDDPTFGNVNKNPELNVQRFDKKYAGLKLDKKSKY